MSALLALHTHLRAGLDYEPLSVDPKDVLECELDENSDERAAKRRRIEVIATQYLKGRVPTLISARLRGPFNDTWENPWAKLGQSVKGRQNKNRVSSRVTKRHTHQRKIIEDLRRSSRAPSPEPSRAIQSSLRSSIRVQKYQDGAIVASGNSIDDNRQLEGTEIFSARADLRVPRRTQISSQWLKRPTQDIGRSTSEDRPHDASLHHSPTPRRQGTLPMGSQRELRLAPPKNSVHTTRSSIPREIQPILGANWMSSAPISTAISSPVDYLRTEIHTAVSKKGSNRDPNQRVGSTSSATVLDGTVECAQPTASHAKPSGPMLLHVPKATTATIQGGVSSWMLAQPSYEYVPSKIQDNIYLPSREGVQRCAERCVPTPLAHTCAKSERQETSAKAPKGPLPPVDFVASPTPNPLVGFKYHKVHTGGAKRTRKSAQKAKLRPMTFESSPAVPINREEDTTPETHSDRLDSDEPSDENIEPERPNNQGPRAPPRDIYDVMATNDEQRVDRVSHKQSSMSTQAAMMLAQLGFQEGTFPLEASDTPRTWFSHQEGDSNACLREPSPTTTPFHTFNAKLDIMHGAPKSVSWGPSMSTQDLFTAASPFSFSTVKKKKSLLRSSLGFTVLPTEDDRQADGNAVKSSTPSAERIPLKDRNSSMLVSADTDNVGKGSQESLLHTTETPSKIPEASKGRSYATLNNLDFTVSLDLTD
ncbi:hypothetical protein CC78DRAFT_105014 [Lojkania enalia]|uniref:Uncharacterized protein n=1 Tax=Lojkania enalia TaxID=147567 RepID=A0A9P4N5I8_9PLEO|nr:hypothetical protein CC78DRAFT_105014 [Didymosphaeria enalia]